MKQKKEVKIFDASPFGVMSLPNYKALNNCWIKVSDSFLCKSMLYAALEIVFLLKPSGGRGSLSVKFCCFDSKPLNRRRLFNIFVFTLLIICHNINSQEVGFSFIRNYTPKEYNNTPQIWSTVEDSKGIVYFGSNEAVIEYDGKKWNPIYTTNKTTVYSLAIDSNDCIFVGTVFDFGYLLTNKQGRKVFKSLKELIPDKNLEFKAIHTIKILRNSVYFLSTSVVFEYNPLSKPSLKLYFPHDQNMFISLFTHEGKIYARESNRGIVQIGRDSTQLMSSFYKDKSFKYGLTLSKDTVVVATRYNGVFFYNPAHNFSSIIPIEQQEFIEKNDIYAAALLPNQTIALGSLNKGLLAVSKDGKTQQTWNEGKQLQDNAIYYIFNSKNHNLWLTLQNGISRTDASFEWSYWDKTSGIKWVTDMLRFNNKLYVTTTTAIYYIENNQPKLVSGIDPQQCWCLLSFKVSENKKILLAGTSTGIYEIKGDHATLLYKSNVLRLYTPPGNPRRIIAGTDMKNPVSLLYENGKWKDEGTWDGIVGRVREIAEDKNGDIWMGTSYQGVIKVTPNYQNINHPKKVVYYSQKNGLPSVGEISPCVIDNKVIFTTIRGLFSYNPQTEYFEPYCKFGNKFCSGNYGVYRVFKNKQGCLLIIPGENKDQDVFYLKPNGNGGYLSIYKPFRRLPQISFTTVYFDDNGAMWFGGSEGLFRYNERADIKNYNADFYALIRKVTIGSDSVVYYGPQTGSESVIKPIALQYKFNTLKFEFAAPFFDDENKTQFSYQLEGFNNSWSNWSNEANAVYTNLYEGLYTFRVKAKNLYDKESIEAKFLVSILPPWYRTWWAYSIYIILLVFFIYCIVVYKSRILQKDKDRLELIVKERTAEIVKKNAELENQNKEIEEQKRDIELKNNKLQELNAARDKFYSIIAHDLKSPFTALLGFSELLIQNMDQYEKKKIKEFIGHIYLTSDQTNKLLENLLD